jgi:hypothetical protein
LLGHALALWYRTAFKLRFKVAGIRSWGEMAVTKIEVSDMIMIGNLFSESGYDGEKSADNLAELKGKIITEHLADEYPDVEICADIAILQEAGRPRPLEVLVYIDNNEIDSKQSAALQKCLCQKIADATTDYSWAVKAK